MAEAPPPPKAIVNLPVDHDWLARAEPEDVLEPDLPIVDAHHHLLDRPDGRYLVPDLAADIGSGHNVAATVFVEGGNFFFRSHGPEDMRAVGETEVVASMTEAAPHGIAAGIVSYADLMQGAGVGELLDAHIAAGGGRFAGIRQLTPWDDDEDVQMHLPPPRRQLGPGMLSDPRFREGFAQLAPRGLVFDVTAFHTQMREVIDLAQAFPDTGIVLDHLGCIVMVGPYRGRRDEIFASWKADLADLAALPNVTVKLGGLGMRMYGFDLREKPAPLPSADLADLWRPYVETCIEAFGPDRAMFESNFPVDKGYFSYLTCWNAFKRLTKGASAEDKRSLYSGTAARVYGLDL